MATAPAHTRDAHDGTWDVDSPIARRHERRLWRHSSPVGYALAEWCRRRGDVVKVPGIGYVVSGAQLTRQILLDGETYTKTGGRSAGVLITQVMGPYALLNMDGPDHVRLKRKLQGLFTPAYVAEVAEAVIGQLVREMHTSLAAGEQVDIAQRSRVLVGAMLCHMAGIRLEGEALERRAIEMFEAGSGLAAMVPLRMKRMPERKLARARHLFSTLVDGTEHAFHNDDDSTIPGRAREVGLSYEEARGTIGMLMLAGTDTLSSALARIVALLCDTGQWERLRQHPELLEQAIDEGLRYTTPVPAFTRTIERDHVLAGRSIRRDTMLLAFLRSAVRDERVIDSPDSFDIARTMPRELRHLWFGAGPHFCIGFNMARHQLSLVLQAIMDLPRPIEIVSRTPARGVLLPTYRTLHVRMKAAS